MLCVVQLQQESTLLRQEAVVERCVRRMQQMSHARVFGRWYEAVQEIKAMRHKVNVVLKRWQTRGLSSVMDAWMDMVDCRVLCRRVMGRLMKQQDRDNQFTGESMKKI